MEADAEGFLRPHIKGDSCVNCGLCENSCSILHPSILWDNHPGMTRAYCVHYKNDTVRLASTSGGAFTALCQWVFQQGGIVFGASYDNTFQVVHTKAENIDELSKLYTAKYAQSQIKNTFREAEEYLNQGYYVLYSGTPCQIAGLISFLGKEYENLILVDMICHGIPSPAVWKHYIQYRSQIDAQGAAPVKINLRSKETGWPRYSIHIDYENGASYRVLNSQDPYLRAFVGDLCLRPSCYDCQFKGISRNSDFTLGDYWGVWDQEPDFNDEKGTSLVLTHTEKAGVIWNEIARELHFKRVDPVSSLCHNPSAIYSPVKPADRELFMTNYRKQNLDDLVDTLCPMPAPPSPKPSWKRVLRKIICLIRQGKAL